MLLLMEIWSVEESVSASARFALNVHVFVLYLGEINSH